jgi:predicted PilT family ATPase
VNVNSKNAQTQEHEAIPARPWGPVTNRNIIPFVDPIANGHVSCFSREDKIRSRLEAAAELMLVATGAAGVVTAVIAWLW